MFAYSHTELELFKSVPPVPWPREGSDLNGLSAEGGCVPAPRVREQPGSCPLFPPCTWEVIVLCHPSLLPARRLVLYFQFHFGV